MEPKDAHEKADSLVQPVFGAPLLEVGQNSLDSPEALETSTEEQRERIDELFTQEHLSSLSLKEYGELLQQYPSEIMAHVVRQGVRDHVGHNFHTQGLGEKQDGFKALLADGRLRPPMGVKMPEGMSLESVRSFVSPNRWPIQPLAESWLKEYLSTTGIGKSTYSDGMAVHLSTNSVADRYYGSETGNEVFVTYPAAMIASQFHFDSNLEDNSQAGYWADDWVWADGLDGIRLDAGIVFLPKDARVDPATGSKYLIDERNQPVPTEHADGEIPMFQPARETISSQDYWETYFTQHPDQRPARVLYYEGDPSEALQSWIGSLGISWQTPKLPVQEIFADHKVTRGSEQTQAGISEFTQLSHQVIGEHFADQDPSEITVFILDGLDGIKNKYSISEQFGFDSAHYQDSPVAKLEKEGYFTFDLIDQEATLTEKGRLFLAGHINK